MGSGRCLGLALREEAAARRLLPSPEPNQCDLSCLVEGQGSTSASAGPGPHPLHPCGAVHTLSGPIGSAHPPTPPFPSLSGTAFCLAPRPPLRQSNPIFRLIKTLLPRPHPPLCSHASSCLPVRSRLVPRATPQLIPPLPEPRLLRLLLSGALEDRCNCCDRFWGAKDASPWSQGVFCNAGNSSSPPCRVTGARSRADWASLSSVSPRSSS